MGEKPILFSGPMVRAILDGTKTQTRRVIQSPAKNMQRAGMQVVKNRAPGDPWYGAHVWSMRNRTGVWGDYTDEEFRGLCPYGAPGDRLVVRETWAPLGDQLTEVIGRSRVFRADADLVRDDSGDRVGWWLGDVFIEGSERPLRWRPSIHMPRWASRITLDVVSVRVERLQDITEAAIEAEGVTCQLARELAPGACVASPFDAWRILWDSINGARPGCSWADDPWVWVVEFRRVAP